MKQTTTVDHQKKSKTNYDRKPYEPPNLQLFGKLHLLTQGSGGNGNDGGGVMNKMSDRRSKENIVRVGDHSLGMGLYLFDYKPEHKGPSDTGRQLGVMADEVETIVPEAVSLNSEGFKMVNYAMLGTTRTF